MKIYITGIAGFLGSHLAKKLKDQGHDVSGNDSMIQGDIENLPKTFFALISNKYFKTIFFEFF